MGPICSTFVNESSGGTRFLSNSSARSLLLSYSSFLVAGKGTAASYAADRAALMHIVATILTSVDLLASAVAHGFFIVKVVCFQDIFQDF